MREEVVVGGVKFNVARQILCGGAVRAKTSNSFFRRSEAAEESSKRMQGCLNPQAHNKERHLLDMGECLVWKCVALIRVSSI